MSTTLYRDGCGVTRRAARETMETLVTRKHRETAIAAALAQGIDVTLPEEGIPPGTFAVYSYSFQYRLADFLSQVSVGESYARKLAKAKPVHFHDGGRHIRSLLALIDLAKAGLIKDVVFKDATVLKFCRPEYISGYLKVLRDAGAEIHFATSSRIEDMTKVDREH